MVPDQLVGFFNTDSLYSVLLAPEEKASSLKIMGQETRINQSNQVENQANHVMEVKLG